MALTGDGYESHLLQGRSVQFCEGVGGLSRPKTKYAVCIFLEQPKHKSWTGPLLHHATMMFNGKMCILAQDNEK